MLNKKFFLISSLLFLIFLTSFISAVPPQQTSETTLTLEIAYPTTVELYEDYYIHTHVYDTTAEELITSGISCYYHFYNHQINGGEHISKGDMTSYGVGYDATINGSLINESGEYSALVWCNSSTTIGFNKYTFEATESGVSINEGRSILIIGLLSLLVFFLFISLYLLINVESYIGKFALYWVSHLLLILITFISWQTGIEGLLEGTAIIGVFRIMFWIFTVSVFPMLILSLAWIFYIHTYNEHFQKLVDKGESTETAFTMAKRKSGGWLNGR